MSLIRKPLALSGLLTLLSAVTTGGLAQTALPVSSYTSSTQFSLAASINDSGVICGSTQQTRNNPAGKGSGPATFTHAAEWTLSEGSYVLLDMGQLKYDGNHSGRWVGSWANCINAYADIVGNSQDGGTGASLDLNSAPGFYWGGSGMSSIATDTTSQFTWAYAVDDNGCIYGAQQSCIGYDDNGGLHTAYYWASSSPASVMALPNLLGTGEKWSEALGSNGTVVVGRASPDDVNDSIRAVYWPTVGSTPVSVGAPSGFSGSVSQLTGVKTVALSGFTDTIAVGFTSDGVAINTPQDITYYANELGAYAYDITTSSFIVLPVPAGGYSTACAVAINTSGVIVGSSYQQALDSMGNPLYFPDGSPILVECACTWTPDSMGNYSVGGAAFLSPSGSFSQLIRATGINSSGTIVGLGVISSTSTVRAFVL